MAYTLLAFTKKMSSTINPSSSSSSSTSSTSSTNHIEKKITKRVIKKTKQLLSTIRNRYELQMDGIRFSGDNSLEDAIEIVKAISVSEIDSEFSVHKRIVLDHGDVVILKKLYVIKNGIEIKNLTVRTLKKDKQQKIKDLI